MKKKLFLLGILITTPLAGLDNFILQGVSFFSPRSQSIDAARNIVGQYPFTHQYESKKFNAVISATPEFTKSFHADHIADALFGTDFLYISGSQVVGRGPNDILADYFGLSPEFVSTVCLSPTIMNFITTFDIYMGFDAWVPGLYFEIYAPAVWTRWNFQMNETVLSDTGAIFPPDYMAANAVVPPINQFSQAFTGNVTFGDMQNPYQFGKICGARTKGGLSDLEMILGYDFVKTENGHLGINARVGAPTGSRPNSEYFFEPIVGNGKHWEFGLGFDGRITVWEKDGYQDLSMFGQLNFTHLFGTKQVRSFDFCDNGFGSRFVLLKQFDTNGNYNGNLLPAINVTSLPCTVSMDLQFEMLFMLGYTHKGFECDVGYNGWIRSKEKISLRGCIAPNTYGFKGIQNVVTATDSPSNATESGATLNGNISNGDLFSTQASLTDLNSPVFIRTDDLNIRSAASPMLMTHKLFTYFGYAWEKSTRAITPFLGGGLSVEFEGINNANTEKPNRNTLSQWAFWLKGGISFI
jgi:hypothetical protein